MKLMRLGEAARQTARSVGVAVAVLAVVAPAHAGRPRLLEDAIADGDADADDVASRGPASVLGRGLAGRAIAPAAAGGGAWVSIVAFAETLATGRDVGAGIVVGVPLDRIGRGRGLRDGPAKPLPLRAALPVIPLTEEASPLPVSRARGDAPVLTAALARATVAAALRVSGLGETDARVDAIASRARWSALLPETRLRAMQNQDERASLESTADASKLRGSAGANLGLEARLTWRLDRLVFADEEPALERLRLERHDARLRLTGKVLEALVQWSRAVLEARASGDDPLAAARVVETEAMLDVLTRGWFGTVRTTRVLVLPPLPGGPAEEEGAKRDPEGSAPPPAKREGETAERRGKPPA